MSWKGVAIGAGLGFALSRSWLSAIFCGVLGHDLEERWRRNRANGRTSGGHRANRRADAPPSDALTRAYELLGVSPQADDETLRKAYREVAKTCHPDVLRAQGLSEEAIGRATERMKVLNSAWGAIKSARGL